MSRRASAPRAAAAAAASSRSSSDSPIDVEMEDAADEVPVAAALRDTLRSLLPIGAARADDLLRGADMDIERALNHHFEQQERAAAATPKPAAAAAAAKPAAQPTAARASSLFSPSASAVPALPSLSSSPPPPPPAPAPRMQLSSSSSGGGSLLGGKKRRSLPSLAPPASLQRTAPEFASPPAKASSSSAAAAAASSTPAPSSTSASANSAFKPASSLLNGNSTPRARLSRAAAPTSFKKKKEPKKKKGSDDDEEEDSEEDSDDDDDDDSEDEEPKKKKNNSSAAAAASSSSSASATKNKSSGGMTTKKKFNPDGSDSEEEASEEDSDESGSGGWDDSGSDSDVPMRRAPVMRAAFRRRAPFGAVGRGRGGAAAAAGAGADPAAAAAAAAAGAAAPAAAAAGAAAPAAAGGRRRGGWGAGRRGGGRGGRVALAAAKRESSGMITADHVDVDDSDEERLAKVVTWNEPPPPLDVLRLGIQLPEKFQDRARWRVGTIVDCNLMDTGRGWERAVIKNIVSAPRTFALSYDVCFEGRRVDVLPDAIFRFSFTDVMQLMPVSERSHPRYEVRDDEQERAQQRTAEREKAVKEAAEAAAAAEDEEAVVDKHYLPSDFKQRQLVDVLVGSRWFLGQVTANNFTMVGDDYEDVIDVTLLDFHSDAARKFTKDSLHMLDPVAYSHPITHYPMNAQPKIREKDFDISMVYATKEPGWAWAREGPAAMEDEEEEKKQPSDEIALQVEEEEDGVTVAASASASAAAAASPSSSSAAAAASPPSSDALSSVFRRLSTPSWSLSELRSLHTLMGQHKTDAQMAVSLLKTRAEVAEMKRTINEELEELDTNGSKAEGASSGAAAAAAKLFGRKRPAAAAASSSSASSSSSAAAAAAAASPSVPSSINVPMRSLGRFSIDVVSDVHYNDAAFKNDLERISKRDQFVERCFVLARGDRAAGARRDLHVTEEQALLRLRCMMQFLSGVSFVRSELQVEPLQVGVSPDPEGAIKVIPPAAWTRFKKTAPNTAAQKALEVKYRLWIRAQLNTPSMRAQLPAEFRSQRLRQLQRRLNEIRDAKKRLRAEAKAEGIAEDEIDENDFDIPEEKIAEEKPKNKASSSELTKGGTAESLLAKVEQQEEVRIAKKMKAIGVAEDGFLRWYRLTFEVSLVRTESKMPKRTSEANVPLNDLMLLLFPESEELRAATEAAIKPLPACVPKTLSLDGLLKHSALFRHTAADKEAEEEARKNEEEEEDNEERKEQRVVPFERMDADALSRAGGLIPTCTLKDYQMQTVRWMLQQESAGHNVSKPYWVPLAMEDGCKFLYSPTLQRFHFTPLPDIKGGWVCEEMGLGKTIEMLAVLNLRQPDDVQSAMAEAQAAVEANPSGVEAAPNARRSSSAAAAAAAAADRIPTVRNAQGAYVSRATLIICPVTLISQWVNELREKSVRPLKILSYHGPRPKDPRQLIDYDVVITAYSILSTESSGIGARSKRAAIETPWAYQGPAGLAYTSPLGQVSWRRIVLDEGHSVKNAAAECSQQATKLLARCRWLMSGTPFGTSLMDLRGQSRFLGMTGFAGSFLFTELTRFMMSTSRYQTLEAKVGANDHDGVPYRTMEWLKRFRNIFTQLVTSSMMRHEKNLLFRGRATLLVLPKTRVEVIRVQLTEVQRAAYNLLYEFAKKRFEAFKASGDAVRKTIEILQLLVPLRQACSAATVNIDVVKQQLKDLAAGIAVGGPAVGVASAPSELYPQAVLTAFGTLADECSICLELLEDAVQTQCRHLFCKECILALCENKGAGALCPNCRRLAPARSTTNAQLNFKGEL